MMVPLNKNQYSLALDSLQQVRVNHLFARFVAEKRVAGTIYTDQLEHPAVFYFVHPYGMSLLTGSTENDDFNAQLRDYLLNTAHDRTKVEWLQAYPEIWNKKIRQLLGKELLSITDPGNPCEGVVEQNTRANFKFRHERYIAFKHNLKHNEHLILKTNRKLFEEMKGTVVPRNFWNSAVDFCKYGVGYSMIIDNKPVCTAYSAYIFKGLLELGIETDAGYRGRGLALHTCSALIDYCIENNYEPVWSCRLENTGSYRLAQKLGFEPTITLPYYRLPV